MNKLQGGCYSALLIFQVATVLLLYPAGGRAIDVERGLKIGGYAFIFLIHLPELASRVFHPTVFFWTATLFIFLLLTLRLNFFLTGLLEKRPIEFTFVDVFSLFSRLLL
mgnify:CR=1 FL=1